MVYPAAYTRVFVIGSIFFYFLLSWLALKGPAAFLWTWYQDANIFLFKAREPKEISSFSLVRLAVVSAGT